MWKLELGKRVRSGCGIRLVDLFILFDLEMLTEYDIVLDELRRRKLDDASGYLIRDQQ